MGHGRSSATAKQGIRRGEFRENTHMENLLLAESYGYVNPTEEEEREIFRYTQGETN